MNRKRQRTQREPAMEQDGSTMWDGSQRAAYPVLANEDARIRALTAYDILDTPEDPAFTDLARVAATVCGTTVAMINLIDRERQFMKAAIGFARRDVPRELSLCAYAITEPERVLTVPDLGADERFAHHPIVRSGSTMLFYAGASIMTETGLPIGTICVMDETGHPSLSPEQLDALQAIARQVMALIELRQERSALRDANQRLETVNERLEDVSRRKSEIISDVSHEFRTPMTTILGYAELIRDEDLEAEERVTFAGDIVRDVERLTRMMDNLLDLERLEAGTSIFRPRPVDLREIIRAESARWETDTTIATHPIEIDVAEETPPILGDADRIAQVVRNLLSNAVKYSPGGGAIVVTGGLDRDGTAVTVSISDHGIGISAEGQARMFQRFTRTAEAIGQGIRGTGLGLAICRQIIELHQGTIGVTSTPGRGSTFWFRVPVAPA